MKKDVESMNHFELLNEVERLRSKDRTKALETEIANLKHELRKVSAEKEKLQRSLEFITCGYDGMRKRAAERRKEAQGRRKAQRRRS